MTDDWQTDVHRPLRRSPSKVPEITVLFWIIKAERSRVRSSW